MRLLQLLLLFYAYAFAQVEISFEQYLNLASEKNWPKDTEIYNAFRDYCNNASASQTTELEGHVFTRADCLTFATQTTELTTLSTTMKMIRKAVNVKKGISYFGVIATDGCSKTTPFTSTTTPPTTTELTTIPKTTEITAEKISIIEGNVRYNFEEPDCDNCITQTSSSSSSSSLSTISSAESSSIQTSTPEEATTSVQILSTESSTTSENTQTSTFKPTELQDVESSSTNPSTVTPTTESLQESTESLETSAIAKTETSIKPTTAFTGIPSTKTETQKDMPSSSQKPTTTLKPTITTKTATSPLQQAATQTETSAKTTTSPISVKPTKAETTTQSGTSTMPSTKLQTSTKTTKSSTVPSTSTAQKTTIKPTTPKKPETTIPQNLQTTVQSMPSSTSTEPRVLETTKTSATSITESTTAQTSHSPSAMPEADTTTRTSSVMTTSPSNEKSSIIVTQDASTSLVEDTSSIASTTSEHSTSTKTIADKKSTTSATSNTVTEITTPMSTTTAKQETSTVSDHLLTDTSTVPAANVNPSKNYPTTTSDVTVVSTSEQALPSTTKSNDAKSLGTTLQTDEALTASRANKMSSTTTPEATIPRIDEISSTKIQTLLEKSSSADNLNTEMNTSTTTIPQHSTSTDTRTTLISTTTPVTTIGENGVESSASISPTSSSTTTKMPTTSLPEIKATESVESTTQSKSTKYSDSTTTSTSTESKPSSTTTTVPVLTENQNDVTSTLLKTTSTLEGSTSSITTIEEKSSLEIVDQTSTESITSTTTKLSFTTEENQATSSSKMESNKITVTSEASTSSTVSASENRQNTDASTEEPIAPTTKLDPSSTTPATATSSKSTKKATESATESTVQSTESTTSSSTAPSNPSSTPSKSTTTKRPTSTTTKPPICNSTCPSGFSEGDYACFKFILPNSTDGAYYDDFLNACISMKGVIASLADFGNIKNVDTFQAMTNAQRPKPAMVYTNAVPTKYHRTTQIVPVVELDEYSLTKMTVIGLSATEKYPNATAICRVGKYCQEYTCPVLEYFIPPTAKYLVATVPPNTVLKENEKLSVECFGTPQRSFDVKCDERGFLLPDSSMVKCEARNVIKSEPDGPVKSCAECDKLQTSSCEPLPSGEYYCNCKELYHGRTCTYPFNACENVTCQNGGTCENRFTYGFCNCETEYFGSVCQYEFYNSYEAWLMRAMTYTVTAVVAAETAVRTKKRLTPSAPGQFASLPTEMCKFYSAIFGSLALACRIMFEFPDSVDLADAVQCGTTFVITMTLAFCSLTAMVAESIIALGVIINATANCYDGHYQERKKCVNNKRLVTCYAFFCILPFVILCTFSSEMVTSRSCIGVLPWQGFPDSQQYAGLGLMVLMSAYTLTACGLALAARQVLDHNIFETRRRYEADLVDPTAYGREVLTVELNVRYYLLALKPLFFTLVWFSAIAAAERMEWWATYLATICSGIYGIISFVQNKLTVFDELDGLIVKGMNWLPKRFAPKYNYITNRTRNDYLKVGDPEKFAKEQEEKLNGGPAICFPIPFNQNLERLMKTNKPGVLNKGAFFKLVPTGFYKTVMRKWKLEYLKHRVSGLTRGDSLRNLWWDIQNQKFATPMCPFTTFINMFINFRDNCWHWDRLDDRDPRSKIVLERGVRMLDIKPSIKIPVAKVKNPATDRRVAFFRDDPLMNFDQQQQKFDLLESLCKSFTSEDMQKDEAETAAYVHKYFYYCNKRRSLLTKRINDNRRRTVHDFLLDERRPNFVGPRTFERQLPPGITYLDHTAYYWECLNYETWKRLRIRAKYIELNIELRYEYNHFGDFLPWNWSRYSWDPNMVFDPSKYNPLDLPNIAEADENEEEEDDEDMEDAN